MDYVTIKLHEETRRLLRLIAAQTGEQMVQVMQRLCEDEWIRLTPDITPEQKVKRGVKTDRPRSNAE